MRQKAHIAQTKLEAARDAVKVAYKTSQAHTAEKRRERAETGTAAEAGGGGARPRPRPAATRPLRARPARARAAGRGRGRRAPADGAVAPSEEAPSGLAEKAKAKQAEAMLAMFEMMWRLSVVDIESTLRSACHKVLYDHSVDVSERLKRAQAMRIVGEVFKAEQSQKGTWQEQMMEQMASGAFGDMNGRSPRRRAKSLRNRRRKRARRARAFLGSRQPAAFRAIPRARAAVAATSRAGWRVPASCSGARGEPRASCARRDRPARRGSPRFTVSSLCVSAACGPCGRARMGRSRAQRA